jgi:hypothetical protein
MTSMRKSRTFCSVINNAAIKFKLFCLKKTAEDTGEKLRRMEKEAEERNSRKGRIRTLFDKYEYLTSTLIYASK